MKFFHSPGTCSLGIRVILEETGGEYETIVCNVAQGEQHNPEYRQINPKGKVPALVRQDGSVLTEFPAIAMWLARSFPEMGLLPKGLEGEVRTLELIDFVVASVHMRGATLAMLPQKFTDNQAAHKDISAHGLKVVNDGLKVLSDMLGEKDYFFGCDFTIGDAAVFYVLCWEERFAMEIPDNLKAFHDRMKARPAVQRALA